MASVGRIEPYDGNCDLEAYLERLELYFIANNVGAISGDDNEAARRLADRKKVATLLTLVGGAQWPSGLERWLGPATGRFPGRVRIPLR